MRLIFVFILIFLSFNKSFGGLDDNFSRDRSGHTDTIRKSIEENTRFGAIKLNPIQILSCEIPVSLEIYRLNRKSIQLQFGYLFKGPGSHGFGPDGTDTNKGLLSYRISPYGNDGGFSIKIEFRNYKYSLNDYGRSFYYAPQLMYKHSYYKDQSHWLKAGQQNSYRQIESKKSNVAGFGIIFGVQDKYNRFIVDWYAGLGFRLRIMEITIAEQIYTSLTKHLNTIEDQDSFFPFINLGVRIGIEL